MSRVIPPSVPVGDQQTVNPFYLFASDYAVPLAIVLLLATADLRSLRLLGRSAILAWVLAAVGSILGTVAAVLLLSSAIGPVVYQVSRGGLFYDGPRPRVVGRDVGRRMRWCRP